MSLFASTTSLFAALRFRCCLRGRRLPRCMRAFLAAGAGGLARGLTAEHQGNILAEGMSSSVPLWWTRRGEARFRLTYQARGRGSLPRRTIR